MRSNFSDGPLNKLIEALRCLPGVGPKSAQRMVYYLLQYQRKGALHLASCLQEAMESITHCQQCNNYTEEALCAICRDGSRDPHLLCVVENPSNIFAIEQSNVYKGYYYVLMGKISPLDGLGPDEIGLPRLHHRVLNAEVKEVILALGASVESQTTIHFIKELLQSSSLHISQLAQGIPAGGELEFLDINTIGCALRNRAPIHG